MKRSLRTLIFSIFLAAAGGWIAPVTAQSHGYGYPSHHRSSVSLGILILGEQRYAFEGDVAFRYELLKAFRCAGYRALCDDGAVIVYYEGYRPRFRLVGCSYRLRITYRPGCIIIRPYLPNQHWYGQEFHRYDRYREYRPHRVRRHRSDYWRWRNRGCRGW